MSAGLFLWHYGGQLYGLCPTCGERMTDLEHNYIDGTERPLGPGMTLRTTDSYDHSILKPCGHKVTSYSWSVNHPLKQALIEVLAPVLPHRADLVADQLLVRLYEERALRVTHHHPGLAR